MKSHNLLDDEDELEDSFGEDDADEEEVNPEFIQDDDVWQVFGELKIDDSYSIGNVHGTKNIYENLVNDKLQNDIYEIFENSPYKEKYANKKPSKSDVLEIMLYFLEKIKDANTYSMCERVVAIADLMKMDYLTVFNEMPTKIRYDIIQELDTSYNIVKTRSKKLF